MSLTVILIAVSLLGMIPWKNDSRQWEKNRDNPVHNIVKIVYSTKKTTAELRRFNLLWKTTNNNTKKNLSNRDLCRSDWPQGKTERKRKEISTNALLENWKKNYETWKWQWYQLARYSHQKLSTETRGFRKKRTSIYHSNYSMVEIGLNIKKNPGDLLSLRVQWKTISL